MESMVKEKYDLDRIDNHARIAIMVGHLLNTKTFK
jgi:hypothetical protein